MQSNNQKARVLVVDDEPDITAVFKRGLEATGFLVDTFNVPCEALSNFKEDYYDVLIFDIKMPKITGFQLY
jgi:DNA-binding response OmpR family regulator